ncbi:hypothetical protein APSETT445_005503 [Aspergillus pseudonomiae]|uniref:Uncharacterized protein n=1 Tax=Aspergillus nomiae NRRL (strain ATCC 15546 / NRRL 13137 / CBS 260.88 / M93) TaxID=1509407 RepID=A0A0L1JH27_ASPN3|nr:uncharacterized protein ANOM_000794 [Aspergillus nomiae NRRL 13137]KNG91069.1 hypothetical protein ANOM_000794 [Aspergillus nomiae NRRL 13137]
MLNFEQELRLRLDNFFRQHTGFSSYAHFLSIPPIFREEIFDQLLTTDTFLIMPDTDVRDAVLGDAILLCQKYITRDSAVTKEALETYYEKNHFQVWNAPYLAELLVYMNDRHCDPDEGFDPKLHIHHLTLGFEWDVLEEFGLGEDDPEATIEGVLGMLSECPNLKEVAFEIKGTPEGISRLKNIFDSHASQLQNLDERLRLNTDEGDIPAGLLLLEIPSDRQLPRRMIPHPWWDIERTEEMELFEEDWWERLEHTEKIPMELLV